MQTKTLSECNVCKTFFEPDLPGDLICVDCWMVLTELNREQGIVAFDLIEQDYE